MCTAHIQLVKEVPGESGGYTALRPHLRIISIVLAVSREYVDTVFHFLGLTQSTGMGGQCRS